MLEGYGDCFFVSNEAGPHLLSLSMPLLVLWFCEGKHQHAPEPRWHLCEAHQLFRGAAQERFQHVRRHLRGNVPGTAFDF